MIAEPVITLHGDKVSLGPIVKILAPLYTKWRNDPEIMLPLAGHVVPYTEADAEAWYDEFGKRGDGSQIHFLVYAFSGEHVPYPVDNALYPVGIVNLFNVNYRNQTANAGSFIAPEYQGHGFATEARRLLLDYAFGPCGLNNVTVFIHADNGASLRVAEKVGYKQIGVQRQGVRRGGEYVDIVLLDATASDWRAAHAG